MTITAKKPEVETVTKLHARDLQSAEVSKASKIEYDRCRAEWHI